MTVRMTATYDGQTVLAKSTRQICQKFVNAGLRPTEPIEVRNFDTGELITRVRYDAEDDSWQRWGKVSYITRTHTPATIVEVPARVETLTVPEQVIDGVVVPAMDYTVKIPAFKYLDPTSVKVEIEHKQFETWVKVASTKNMVEVRAPLTARGRTLNVSGRR